MGDYRNIDQLRTNELAVVKKGFWKPEFELTDGQFVYAKLRYRSNFKRDAIIETPQVTYTIKRKGWFNRTILVNKGEDETIGTLVPETWKRDFNLKMDNGFEATYLYKKLFSKSLSLTNDTQGDILQITQKAFNFKQPYTVIIDQVTQQANTPPLPLLAFMGLVIIMLRQQQAATQ
ncbi:hypothetical protein [Mucilaginibacter aquariorum]|uniref:Uncharacterized protein n=1 Tax=Mucilaginibacter aquariorum TaxID=2967225 RepID=A0ABT1SYB7_9SPHI|nr:hypothetical protein [Mucilaginibacter aquariorum]MCQ6957341.1 hypothetical protein [Mucilaginibacter aquariorum]